MLAAPWPAVVLNLRAGMNVCPQVRQTLGGIGSRRRAALRRSLCRCRYSRLATVWQARHQERRSSAEARRIGNASIDLTVPQFAHRFSAGGVTKKKANVPRRRSLPDRARRSSTLGAMCHFQASSAS